MLSTDMQEARPYVLGLLRQEHRRLQIEVSGMERSAAALRANELAAPGDIQIAEGQLAEATKKRDGIRIWLDSVEAMGMPDILQSGH